MSMLWHVDNGRYLITNIRPTLTHLSGRQTLGGREACIRYTINLEYRFFAFSSVCLSRQMNFQPQNRLEKRFVRKKVIFSHKVPKNLATILFNQTKKLIV